MERRGIRTEKSDYNREILERRSVFMKAKETFKAASDVLSSLLKRVSKKEKEETKTKPEPPKKNEVLELIDRVTQSKGYVLYPEGYGLWKRFLDETKEKLKSPAFIKKFVEDHAIDSFEALKRMFNEAYSEYDTLSRENKADGERAFHLKSLIEAYDVFKP